MNRRLFSLNLMSLLFAAAGGLPTNGQTPANSDQPVLIVMEGVPLPDAIRNLARQDNMNVLLDPVLSGSMPKADGTRYQPPTISKRLENMTTRAALEVILKEHKLVLIDNPVTTVCRITFADRGAKAVPASQVVGDTNKIVPLLLMDEIPLNEALNQLAQHAGLKITLDPKVSGTPATPGGFSRTPYVSFRWEKISAAQALAAMLDAYDLEMRLTEGETYRVSPKPKLEGKAGASQPAQNPNPAK